MNVESVYICPAAMGYSVSLYVNHDLKRSWFCDVELLRTKYDDDDNDIGEVFNLEDAETYGSELKYIESIQLIPVLKLAIL